MIMKVNTEERWLPIVETKARAGKTVVLKVADVMTENPLTVEPSDTLEQVEELLEEHRIRQLPVVEGTVLVGIITDRDIRPFLRDRYLGSPEEQERVMKTTVAAVMSPKPITLSPNDDLKEAIELLIEEKMGGIPVVDQDGEAVVGIVTYVDVLRCFLELLQEE
ncbi:MAG: CBS domain-containing protein [Deltaproteobacteria bacterium]|nr:CBS domain-containing protein [Deltaproteobacteria bacterium]